MGDRDRRLERHRDRRPARPRGGRLARRQVERARAGLERRDPLWPAQVALLAAIALGITMPPELTIGPPWLLPAFEGAVLLGVVGTTPRPPGREDQRRRAARLVLVGLVSAFNVVVLFLLTRALLDGGHASGGSLVVAGAVLWLTAVLLFAIWFWEFDGDGPIHRGEPGGAPPDFQFPQMESDGWDDWMPQFTDYLYLSLTNAATFGPADTVPLTAQAKLMMALQTVASLMTTTIVLAYAINNLSG
jgi:uncharacterized membrane protein